MPLAVAKEALDRAVTDSGLVAESRRSVDEGLVLLMPVGVRVFPRRRTCRSSVSGTGRILQTRCHNAKALVPCVT